MKTLFLVDNIYLLNMRVNINKNRILNPIFLLHNLEYFSYNDNNSAITRFILLLYFFFF